MILRVGSSMPSDAGSGEPTTLSPDEAFAVLGDDTRLQILQMLGAADEPLAFSELFDRIEYHDSSNFGYHLDKLVDHFVRKTDEGYALRQAGRRVVEAILSGAVTDDPVLVGWSMGAVWIADYLSVEGEDDIAGVNLVGPAPLFEVEDPTTVFGEGFLDFLERGVFVSTDVEESITGIDEFISLVTAEPLPPRERVLLFGIIATVPPRVRANLLAREVAYDDLLPEIESPVLITHGEEDELILPGVARRICEAIPNARTSFYPEVGHAPVMEDSERFNRELREFAAEPY